MWADSNRPQVASPPHWILRHAMGPGTTTRPYSKDRLFMQLGTSGRLVSAPGSILGGDPAKYRKGAVFPAPGWGLYSTAEDLLHVYRMMLNNGMYEGKRYLSRYSVHLMTEAHTTGIHPVGWMRGSDYGLAWEVVTDPLGELAGHSMGTCGHGGAFGTQGWIDPSNNLISVLLILSARQISWAGWRRIQSGTLRLCRVAARPRRLWRDPHALPEAASNTTSQAVLP